MVSQVHEYCVLENGIIDVGGRQADREMDGEMDG